MKKKPRTFEGGLTTRTIEKFSNDAKGIRAGDVVCFTQRYGKPSPVIKGVVQRIFEWAEKPKPDHPGEEIKIKGDDGKRYYRFERHVFKVSSREQ
jgi:hypothetical protein